LTPLLHTSFLPLLLHVYVYPLTTVFTLIFVHAAPVLTAPAAIEEKDETRRIEAIRATNHLLCTWSV